MNFNNVLGVVLLGAACVAPIEAYAQFNLSKVAKAAGKAAQALTLSDEQMAAYVKQSVDWMDKNNPVLPEDNEYVVRLRRLTEGVKDADGIPLNFKVYDVVDINAFACPDGSVRVFSSLMDIMSDDELMGVIGHEIGHVLKRHSKNAPSNNSCLPMPLLTPPELQAAKLPVSQSLSSAQSVKTS